MVWPIMVCLIVVWPNDEKPRSFRDHGTNQPAASQRGGAELEFWLTTNPGIYRTSPTWLDEVNQETSFECRIPQSSDAAPAKEDHRPNQRRAHPVAGSRGCETTGHRSMR